MDDRIFYQEIVDQIKFALIAIEDLNNEIQQRKNGNADRFWYSIQSFLIAIGNISKILYPSPTSPKMNLDRGNRLRKALDLPEESILSDKRIRNCFEHYDEKLDKFLESNNGIYISKAITDDGRININGKATLPCVRMYTLSTKIISFNGVNYNMQDVLTEIIKLKEIIKNY